MLKNLVLKFVTMLAVTINTCLFVLVFWHYEGFAWTTGLIITWTLSVLWIIGFTYVNLFHRFKK